MIRLLIAARSPVTRAGLEALAASSPGVAVVGAYADLSALDDLRPDVVLSDAAPEGPSAAPVVLLAAEAQPEWTAEMPAMGVRAVLSSRAAPDEILAAVAAAAAGFALLDPTELEALLAAGVSRPTLEQPLTPRELEVLRMMAEGAANKTIAWKLNISEHTVKFHVAAIMSKLGAGSRTEAVTTGIRRGLILI